MPATRLHKFVRGLLAVLAAGSAPAMHAAGYQGGAETTIGLDGGTLRDLTTVALSLGAVFYPQITSIWKALTQDPRFETLENRVRHLEQRLTSAESADDADA